METILEVLEKGILDAAAVMVEAAEGNLEVKAWYKGDSTVVSSLDLESEQVIFKALRDTYPIVSEESTKTHSFLTSKDSFILLDPLDGTTASRRFLTSRGGQVGFGPLIGYIEKGVLQAAAFYHVPHRTLFSAIRGKGVSTLTINEPSGKVPLTPFQERPKLKVFPVPSLLEVGVLFYMGARGEGRIIERLKLGNHIDSVYRFGGFANDCSRLSHGYEQMSFQLSVKAWDFPATLFPLEAGVGMRFDPLGQKVSPEEWRVQMENPVLILHEALMEDFYTALRQEGF